MKQSDLKKEGGTPRIDFFVVTLDERPSIREEARGENERG